MGIGFAIPVNLAKEEIEQLKSTGKVVRGWLGVLIQRVTPEISESMGLQDDHGALVADVLKDGPAKTAGIQRGDVIVSFDNKPILASQELPLMVGRTPVGKSVKVKIIRNKAAKELPVTITASREEEIQKASAVQEKIPQGKETTELGLYVQDLTPQIAQELGLKDNNGVVISAVRPGSSADEAGLKKRDVILEVNRQAVKDLGAYERMMKTNGKGKTLLLLVKRDESTIFVPLKPES
jgi:serine protease Do